MKHLNILLSLIIAGFFLFGTACNDEAKKTENNTTDTTAEKTEVKKDCDDVHWSHHQGEEGPENWANLCEGFSACGGNAQSPIDIVTANAVLDESLAALEFNYGYSPVEVINNGHTVQFNTSGDNSMNIGDKNYKLLQFHYHALSEHTINGEHSALEVHFVHKLSDTDLAVIGIMIEEGEESPLFAKYLSNLPDKDGKYVAEDDSLELISLLPEDKSYFHYKGSLTTPPCSEVVSWYVLKTPLTASAEQIEQFSAILDNNYRPVMPLNGRELKASK